MGKEGQLCGSATIKIRCRECHLLSPSLRVYLYWEDGQEKWKNRTMPENWLMDEEASFVEDENEVWGNCPQHKEVSV